MKSLVTCICYSLIGVSIGLLIGLSESPTIASVISLLLTASVMFIEFIALKHANAHTSAEVRLSGISVLTVFIVFLMLGSVCGMCIRNYDMLHFEEKKILRIAHLTDTDATSVSRAIFFKPDSIQVVDLDKIPHLHSAQGYNKTSYAEIHDILVEDSLSPLRKMEKIGQFNNMGGFNRVRLTYELSDSLSIEILKALILQ